MNYLSTYLLQFFFIRAEVWPVKHECDNHTLITKFIKKILSQFGDFFNLQKGEFVTKYSPPRKLCDLLATFWENKNKIKSLAAMAIGASAFKTDHPNYVLHTAESLETACYTFQIRKALPGFFLRIFSSLTCLKKPVISKWDLLWWKALARLYWALLTSGRYQPACHYF
jgi:hypothetical protein